MKMQVEWGSQHVNSSAEKWSELSPWGLAAHKGKKNLRITVQGGLGTLGVPQPWGGGLAHRPAVNSVVCPVHGLFIFFLASSPGPGAQGGTWWAEG